MQNLNHYLSQFDSYNEGYFPQRNYNHHYFLGVNYSTAQVPILFSHSGSSNLDRIQAFDLAEVKAANLGQINMITVSSFCGPQGKVIGLDAMLPDIPNVLIPELAQKLSMPIFDANTLVKSFSKITGTPKSPLFPFMPGSHVPCATKYLIEKGPCQIYAGIAIGIPKDRSKAAILLMEDIGFLPENISPLFLEEKICRSILAIGQAQNVTYSQIFVGTTSSAIPEGFMGCALVACPYFLLAKNAAPILHFL